MSECEEMEKTDSGEGKKIFIGVFGVLSLALSIMFGYYAGSYFLSAPGFWTRAILIVIAIVAGTPLGVAGATIGDAFRRAACPDQIKEDSFLKALQTNLYWAIGPQLIGMFIGVAVGTSLTAGMVAKYLMR